MRTLLALLALSVAASAADSITPGAVVLRATPRSVSVVAPYTGDDDGDATVAVRVRGGGEPWRYAYTPTVDRRATVGGAANVHVRQGRAVMVGLRPGAAYEVAVDWTDPDGGSASATNSITLPAMTWPTSGVRYVNGSAASEGDGTEGSPWKTLTNANAQAPAGSLILVADGSYIGGTWTNSGTGVNWTTISGTGASISGLTLNASQVRFAGVTFPQRNGDSAAVSGGSRWVFDACSFPSVSAAGTYGDAGLAISGASVSNGIVRGCSFTTTNTGNSVFGIYGEGEISGSLLIEGNTFSGGFRDAISRSAQSTYDHGLILSNTVAGWDDDGIEFEGNCINAALVGNTIIDSPSAASCIGLAGPTVGPAYVARNWARTTNSGSYGIKAGVDQAETMPVHLFHNTVIAGTNAVDAVSRVGGTNWAGLVSRNNILIGYRYAIYRGTPSQSWDYDVVISTANGYVADEWNGSSYTTLAAFTAGTGQETHGVAANPGVGTGAAIGASSSARNTGVALSGWNDAGSPWPSSGSPDVGAYEFRPAATNILLVLVDSTARGLMGPIFDQVLAQIRREGRYDPVVREVPRWTGSWSTNDWPKLNQLSNIVAEVRPAVCWLVGRVARLMTGLQAADGHELRRIVTDDWLGCVNLVFTDTIQNSVSGYPSPMNSNVPGDGIPDQTTGEFSFPVMRLDASGLTSAAGVFGSGYLIGQAYQPAIDEGYWLRCYLTNNLAFRQKAWSVTETGHINTAAWFNPGYITATNTAVTWTQSGPTGPAGGTFRWVYDANEIQDLSGNWFTAGGAALQAEIGINHKSYQMEVQNGLGATERRLFPGFWPRPLTLVAGWCLGGVGAPVYYVSRPSDVTVADAIISSVTSYAAGSTPASVWQFKLIGDPTLPLDPVTQSAPSGARVQAVAISQ